MHPLVLPNSCRRGDEGCAGPSGCGDVQGQGCFPRNGNRFGAVKRRATNETRLKALAKKRVRDLRGMFAESSRIADFCCERHHKLTFSRPS